MSLNIDVYKTVGFTTEELRSLEQLLEESALHWISLGSEGIYEIVLDNQMLSTFRQCPSHFIELYVKGLMPKGTGSRSWHLDFGIVFHKMMEIYYKNFREKNFEIQKWAINQGVDTWNAHDMEFHKDHKEYKSIGGVQGLCGLLLGYAMRFGPENERLRVIGTEIAFGKAKEVLLGSLTIFKGIPEDVLAFHAQFPDTYIAWGTNGPPLDSYLNCFLSGRIDVLVDDGNYICPMDHKTMGSFRNDPAMKFELDEGPTGYVYAVSKILPEFLRSISAEDVLLKRSTNKIVMNFISKSIPKEGDRYKRANLHKTTEQLENYRLRMLATSEDLFRSLVRYAHTGVATRDTSKCTNWYMHDCMYLGVHRQNSKANELIFLDSFFEKRPIWNTEEV